MTPVERTGAGYRIYDDASLDRLAFIARAKQLGCTLDEISDLVGVWDGRRCEPVQTQLRALVEAKRDEARSRIQELVALSGQLQEAAAALGSHTPEGPCDDTCGCVAATSGPGAAAVPTPHGRRPDPHVPARRSVGGTRAAPAAHRLHARPGRGPGAASRSGRSRWRQRSGARRSPAACGSTWAGRGARPARRAGGGRAGLLRLPPLRPDGRRTAAPPSRSPRRRRPPSSSTRCSGAAAVSGRHVGREGAGLVGAAACGDGGAGPGRADEADMAPGAR